MYMENKYKYTKTTVSMVNYHIVFCPRYRRKIFRIPGVEQRFKELTMEGCRNNDIDIIAMECQDDHVHLFISVYPQLSIPDAVRMVKGFTSYELRKEFKELSEMPSLWTRSYFVSTAGAVSSEVVQWYVETQKKRG